MLNNNKNQRKFFKEKYFECDNLKNQKIIENILKE